MSSSSASDHFANALQGYAVKFGLTIFPFVSASLLFALLLAHSFFAGLVGLNVAIVQIMTATFSPPNIGGKGMF